MSDRIPVAPASEFQKGRMEVVECDGRQVLVCATAEGVYALENRCSHADQALSEGKLKGHRIICPLHGAAFDVRTGEALSRPARDAIDTFPVVLEDDHVFIEAP